MVQERDVAIVGVYTTKQERGSDRTTTSILMEAIHGALDDAGLTMQDVDGFFGHVFPAGNGRGVSPGNVAWQLGINVRYSSDSTGSLAVLEAVGAVRAGLMDVGIVPFGQGRQRPMDGAVALGTRPSYEFTEWTGSISAAQIALQAQRHMYEYGTTREQLAHATALIRNNGNKNPNAVMFQRGPYTAEQALQSKMVADPFSLLMCSIVTDGGGCIVVASAEKARECRKPPVWILGGSNDRWHPTYFEPPTLIAYRGRERNIATFGKLGLKHEDVDTIQNYDHFPIALVIQPELIGFCEPGEGGPFLLENSGLDQKFPAVTDGGNLSFTHPGDPRAFKVIEAVRQLRGEVHDMCPDWESGVHTFDRDICRKVRDPKIAVAAEPHTGGFCFSVLAKD